MAALPQFFVGESLERARGEIAGLRDMVERGAIRAKRTDETEGDRRYWGADVAQSPLLERLKAFGERHFIERTGRAPVLSFVMINLVDARTCPAGSGGGWHRDALTRQYKAFVYLTDVERAAQGAFCFIPASNSLLFRVPSLVHRMFTGGHRYSDTTMAAVLRTGVAAQPVLLKSGLPFFAATSLIHRGLPISEGRRIAATLYMCETPSPEFADLA